jgi:hypothetical protein
VLFDNSAVRTRFARVLCWSVAAAMMSSVSQSANAELIYGATGNNRILSWDSNTPGSIAGTVQVTGLQSGETIEGLDFRPANGELYALGSSNRVYVVNITTGQATAAGGAFTPGLSGGHFGFDFNPVVDRIRETSNSNQNQVLNPDTGAVVATDPDFFYAQGDKNFGRSASINNVAYTNNFFGATSTTLYGIDSVRERLVTINTSNAALSTVGALGIMVKKIGGFDISGTTGIAYAALQSPGPGKSRFYSINLQTGVATLIGDIGDGNLNIRAMTIAIPGPGALLVIACGLLVIGTRRRSLLA